MFFPRELWEVWHGWSQLPKIDVGNSLGSREPNVKCANFCCVQHWAGRAGESLHVGTRLSPGARWPPEAEATLPAPHRLLSFSSSSPFPQLTRVRLVTCWARSTTTGRASSPPASCSASAWTGPSAASPSAPTTCGCRPPSAPTPGG